MAGQEGAMVKRFHSGRAERIVQLVRELDRLDTTRELIGLVAAPVKL